MRNLQFLIIGLLATQLMTTSAWALDVRPAEGETPSTTQRVESDHVSFDVDKGQVAVRQVIPSDKGSVEQWVVSFVNPDNGERDKDASFVVQVYPHSDADNAVESLSQSILASLEKRFGTKLNASATNVSYDKMGSASGYQFTVPQTGQHVQFAVKSIGSGLAVVLTQGPQDAAFTRAANAWLNSIAFGQSS